MPWLDVQTGTLRLDGVGLALHPRLTLESAQADPAWTAFEPWQAFPPHRSFTVRAPVDATPMLSVVRFDGQRLRSVSMTLDDPAVTGTSWTDYDPEHAREAHDEWLRARLGSGRPWQERYWPFGGVEYEYDWGSVGSFLHPQDSTASMVLSYA